jgi:hypothetical protein
MRRITGILAGVLLLSAAATGLAQEASDAARRAARQLGSEGISLYEKQQYAEALEKLARAYDMHRVPTLGLWYARALASTGKLLDASERYEEVMRLPVPEDATEVMLQARDDAVKEHQQLQARIPTLEITLVGAAPSEVLVTIDGKSFDSKLIGLPIALNLGDRQVEIRRGSQAASQTVSLKEGDRQKVTLNLAPPDATVAPTAVPAAQAAPAPVTPAAVPAGADAQQDRGAAGGDMQSTLGWVAVGVGGAGLVLGTVTGIMTRAKESDLDQVCRGDACPPNAKDDIDAYDGYYALSTVGFVVGGIGLLGGAALLLTAPDELQQAAEVRPFIGIGSAGVQGRF